MTRAFRFQEPQADTVNGLVYCHSTSMAEGIEVTIKARGDYSPVSAHHKCAQAAHFLNAYDEVLDLLSRIALAQQDALPEYITSRAAEVARKIKGR